MRRSVLCCLSAAVVVGALVPAAAAPRGPGRPRVEPAHSLGLTSLVSVGTGGGAANAASSAPGVSSGGAVVFVSTATDLGFTAAGGHSNVYLRTNDGHTILISRTSGDAGGNGDSDEPVITQGGRFIAFHSKASNLVTGDANGSIGDVFLYDRDPSGNGVDGSDYALTLVSTASGGGNNDSDQPAIVASGSTALVAFRSAATNLVPSDTNNNTDVFLWEDGAITRQSLSTTGHQLTTGSSSDPAVAATPTAVGVAFDTTSSDVAPDDSNGLADVYLRSTPVTTSASGGGPQPTTTRISGPIGGLGDGASTRPSISDDGTRIAYESTATNIGFDTTTSVSRVFVHDATAQTVVGLVGGNASETSPAITGDGRKVAFVSDSAGLVSGDLNAVADVFVADLTPELADVVGILVTRVSMTSADGEAGAASSAPAVAEHGQYVAFASDANNLVPGTADTNGASDVFLRQRDMTAPSAPTAVPDSRHPLPSHTYSDNRNVYLNLSAQDDPTAPSSGILGYISTPYGSSPKPATIRSGIGDYFSKGATARTLSQGSDSWRDGPAYITVWAVDADGNVSAPTVVGPFLIDIGAPDLHVSRTPGGTTLTDRKITVHIGGKDDASGVKSYDVYYTRTASYRKAHSNERHYVVRNTKKTTITSPQLAGGTYYFFVVGRDKAGNVGNYPIRGFMLPTAVARLSKPGGWTSLTSSHYFGGEAWKATKVGQGFSTPFAGSDHLSPTPISYDGWTFIVKVVATTCPSCGSLRLTARFAHPQHILQDQNSGVTKTITGVTIATLNLHSATTKHGVVFTRAVQLPRLIGAGCSGSLGCAAYTAVPPPQRIVYAVFTHGAVEIEGIGQFSFVPPPVHFCSCF